MCLIKYKGLPMSDKLVNASTDTSKTPSTDVDYKALYETSEERRKEAQSTLTPVQQENARLKAELAVQGTIPVVDAAEAERLDDLKHADPEKWREELNQAEEAHNKAYNAAVDAKQVEIVSEMDQAEVTRRTKAFFAGIPAVDPKVVIGSMPKALNDMIDAGEIGLEDALQRGVDLINGATVSSVLAPSSPNLSKVAGANEPTNDAKKKQASQDWSSALV